MRQMFSAACGLAVACTLATDARADQAAEGASGSAVVVELFTSQGCVSCPPADEFFAGLTRDPKVIALSLHVDYWDYIGWEDSFGNPAFTERQKNYARAIGSRTIYTPQFVIGGADRIEGFDPEETMASLARNGAAPSPVRLKIERRGEVLVILADADPPLDAPVRVELVRYMPEETVAIERGENAGKTVTYRNIVTSWETLGEWSGQEALELSAPVPGSGPVVVIVQRTGPSAILAAAQAE
ncbi:DUF1223 domain-containing protein [Pseudogemmobacter humi]|uniref:DUF1223 domain-containing protein n=1 Tax=Pseudogemmobacter humi TaxID=2483812 RepID=A0A3P5XQ52_9RHOB|nr:DUF1223 domain-containing protein [Pseudogemmobacter humi]VDC32985.1 hypothetical protein XINFAN_03533 [Pseudogemmobacter humi]